MDHVVLPRSDQLIKQLSVGIWLTLFISFSSDFFNYFIPYQNYEGDLTWNIPDSEFNWFVLLFNNF